MSNNNHKTSLLGRASITAAAVILLVIATVITVLIRSNRNDSRRAGPAASPTATSSSGSTAGSPSRPASSATTSPAGSATTSQSTSAPVALLPHGQEASRASIPWSQVNDGWNLRAWTSVTNQKALAGATPTLYLINPIGGRYKIGVLPPGSTLQLWSPDHRRAIVSYVRVAGRDNYQEWDLSTGRALTSFAQNGRVLLGYTRPLGLALMTRTFTSADQLRGLERIATDGAHQQDYPIKTPALGLLEGQSVLYTPDGSQFLIGAQRGFALFSNSGKLLRQLPRPAGTSTCYLTHWWSDREALASCYRPNGSQAGSVNLFRIPIDGAASTPLTFATPPDYGFTNGWKFSGGLLAQRAGSCGPGELAMLSASGKPQPFHYRLPAGVSGRASVAGVYQDQATLVTGLCGEPGRSLLSLNLRTWATTALLGAGLNGGTIF